MKKFLDRISDLLELPNLPDSDRRLRGKTAYVLSSSVSEEVSSSFLAAFEETFEYLGMVFGGYIHASCEEGYLADNYAKDLSKFSALFK